MSAPDPAEGPTDAMLRAGRAVLLGTNGKADSLFVVSQVYLAMRRAWHDPSVAKRYEDIYRQSFEDTSDVPGERGRTCVKTWSGDY